MEESRAANSLRTEYLVFFRLQIRLKPVPTVKYLTQKCRRVLEKLVPLLKPEVTNILRGRIALKDMHLQKPELSNSLL
jgi:hypothetical protein